MAFNEDLGQFYSTADFAVSATYGSETGPVIFDTPENIVGNFAADVITAEIKISFPATQFVGIDYGASITVDGQVYRVNSAMLTQDGKLMEVMLSK